MTAFFLLMWLLNATTESQRKGLADYFSPTTHVYKLPGIGLALVDEAVSLPEVVEGLNALGVSPHDKIDILKAIKAAGALHAEFIVQ